MDEGSAISADIKRQWDSIRSQLRAELGDATFNSWVAPLALGGVSGRQVSMVAPSRFLRDWVTSHYGERIGHLWRGANQHLHSVDICFAPPAGHVPRHSGLGEGEPSAALQSPFATWRRARHSAPTRERITTTTAL